MFSPASIYRHVAQTIRLNAFLREEIDINNAYTVIETNITSRNEQFLSFLKNVIYTSPHTPYYQLLKHARLQFKDVQSLVNRHGIEDALNILFHEGIYITFEEFKQSKPIIRKGKTFKFNQNHFINPSLSKKHLIDSYSGGSRGKSCCIRADRNHFMQRAMHEALLYEINDVRSTMVAAWMPALLYSFTSLCPHRFAKNSIATDAWFGLVQESTFFRKTWFSIRNSLLRMGNQYPWPNPIESLYSDIDAPLSWILKQLSKQKKCTMITTVSAATRLCIEASKTNMELKGALFIVHSEPFTKAKYAAITKTGATAVNAYYFTEGGFAGFSSTGEGHNFDDIHLFTDNFALLTPEKKTINGLKQFYFSSFYPGNPILMINMENGDCGKVTSNPCHCPLYKLGYTTRISNIRSFKRINTEGMTFYVHDIIYAIDELLPKLYGGSSLDYQVIERENNNGLSKIELWINPDIDIPSDKEVIQTLLSIISYNIRKDRKIKIFNQADSFSVLRNMPLITKRGKLLPFYQAIKQ